VGAIQVVKDRSDIVEAVINALSLLIVGHERERSHIHGEGVLWFLCVDGFDPFSPTYIEIPALSPGVRGALWFIFRVPEEFPEEPVDNPILALAEFPLALPRLVSPVRFALEERLERDRVIGSRQLIDEGGERSASVVVVFLLGVRELGEGRHPVLTPGGLPVPGDPERRRVLIA
jgi:hypothetical protein